MWSVVGGRMLRPLLLVPLLIVVLSVTTSDGEAGIGMLSNCTAGNACNVQFNYLTHGICSKEAVFNSHWSLQDTVTKCEAIGRGLSCGCSAPDCIDINDFVKKTITAEMTFLNGLKEYVNITFQCLRDILGEDLTWSDEKFESYTASPVTVPYTQLFVNESAGILSKVEDCFKDENEWGCYLKFNHLRDRWCSEKDLGMEVYKLKEDAETGCNIFKDFMACKCTKDDCPDIKTLLPKVLDYDDDYYGFAMFSLRGGHLSYFTSAKWCMEKLVENNDLTSWDGTFSEGRHEIPEKVYIVGDQIKAPPLGKDPTTTTAPTSASTVSFGIAAIVFCPILIHRIVTHV